MTVFSGLAGDSIEKVQIFLTFLNIIHGCHAGHYRKCVVKGLWLPAPVSMSERNRRSKLKATG
jgi:hypothetical protein